MSEGGKEEKKEVSESTASTEGEFDNFVNFADTVIENIRKSYEMKRYDVLVSEMENLRDEILRIGFWIGILSNLKRFDCTNLEKMVIDEVVRELKHLAKRKFDELLEKHKRTLDV